MLKCFGDVCMVLVVLNSEDVKVALLKSSAHRRNLLYFVLLL